MSCFVFRSKALDVLGTFDQNRARSKTVGKLAQLGHVQHLAWSVNFLRQNLGRLQEKRKALARTTVPPVNRVASVRPHSYYLRRDWNFVHGSRDECAVDVQHISCCLLL